MFACGLALAVTLAVDAGAPPRPVSPALLRAPNTLSPEGPPAPRDEDYELRPAKDGTGDVVYEGTTFTARVAPDGVARFVDRKGLQLNRGLSLIPFIPLPMPNGTPSLQGVVVDLLAKRQGAPRPAPRDEPRDPPLPVPNVSRYRPDPREACRRGTPCAFEGDPLPLSVTGRFDLTDELLRINGEDPYRYQKARFLAATRERRAHMAARALAANVSRAAAALTATLGAITCDGRRSIPERRAIIQALRAELDGGTSAGHDARATLDGFVASHFGVDAGADAGVRCDAR